MGTNSEKESKKVERDDKKIVCINGTEYDLDSLFLIDMLYFDDDELTDLYNACKDLGYDEYILRFFEPSKEEKKEYSLPISESDAVKIAEADENLRSDFAKNSPDSPTSYSIRSETVNTAIKDGKEYWLVQVTECMFGGCYEVDGEECYYDCYFNEEQLDNLRCLIGKETGAYIYYPRVRKKKNIFQKLKDVVMRTETVVFDPNINMDIEIIKDPDDDDDDDDDEDFVF